MLAQDRLRADERIKSLGGIGLTMLSGFNTNFRYRGVLFHVQTEDSGRDNPHVITHLFHGGNIIVSEKQKYSELLVEEEDLESAVKKLMQGQHKAMLRQLSRGEFDPAIGERLGPDVFSADTGTGSGSDDQPIVTEEQRPPATARQRSKSPIPPTMAKPVVLAKSSSSDPSQPEKTAALSRVFGDRVVSEKPLDEVVLDYLVENARKRRRQPK